MKEVSNEVKAYLEAGGKVYTAATLYVYNNETEQNEEIALTPENFSVTGNSYTQNGGSGFPIGNVLSKSIKLSIINENRRFNKYRMESAKIVLASIGYDPAFRIKEGLFYVTEVAVNGRDLKLTAFDMAYFMDGKYIIRTANPSSPSSSMYATLWDYFVYLCDTVLAEKMGITLASGQHMYSSNLNNGFLNSDMPLSAIQPDSRSTTTLRDIFGYIAQIAGGNIVIRSGSFGDSFPVVDIVSYTISDNTFYYGGEFSETVNTTLNGETFAQTGTNKRLVGGLFSNTNFILLNKYSSQSINRGDSYYTKVKIYYPIPNVTESGSASYSNQTDPDENILELNNPLCQADTDGASKVETVAQNIFFRICGVNGFHNFHRLIKQFDGKYPSNVLAEFMDNVVVVGEDGEAYSSFIGEITYNYLGETNIRNQTPTNVQNTRTYI